MRTEAAINHFGGQSALARALGIKQPSVAAWGEFVPLQRQYQIELATHGLLKAELPAARSSTSVTAPATQDAA